MLSMVVLLFQYQPVQTWAAKKGAAYLSKKFGTEVSIKSLYIKPFSSVVLEDFYALDQQKDTLVRTSKLTVELNGFSVFSSIKKRFIDFKLIQLDNGSFYLKTMKGNVTNLKFILDHLQSSATPKTQSKPWSMVFEKIAVNNFHFRYKNQTQHEASSGMNFDDIDVKNVSTVLNNIDVKNHVFKADVEHLTLREKSGFYLKDFTANTTIDTNLVLLKNMVIQTPRSVFRDYLRLQFKGFDDFSDFVHKVHMDGNFKSSHLSSTDIAYFAGTLKSFELGIDGKIQGQVSNLKAKNLLVTTATNTYVRADFDIKGLPDFKKAFFDVNFDQLATNKRDIDYLYSHFSGNPKAVAPPIVAKLGNVNFSGRFTGALNNFVAHGTFKTGLGRFDPDINLKIDKNGTPSYKGKIDAYNFDLGSLIDDNTLGRATFTANIKGSGDALKNLDEDVTAKIAYINFKGYDYHDVNIKGTFAHKKIDAKLTINDKNIKFDGIGSLDLNPELPVYDFTASVHDAHLNILKLLKDTITVSAQMKTRFSGNTLKNFEGNVLFSPIRIINPRNNYLLDSVYVFANGKGNSREIGLQSDAVDGSIKGGFDLATLPAYFKTIVKKYIPSLNIPVSEYKPQNFEFRAQIKNLDPLTALFFPALKIPERGTFTGKFDSENKTATLNGYIKTIKYGDMVFHNFILDESTSDKYMGLNISLSKIDLTDKLNIQNIEVANFLKNDSLNFNVKLADKDATNQLDLYGLVEFGRDTTAKLKLLPSDIILEHQNWRLDNQVRIRLLDGKTQVSGFELSNNNQKVRIDGFISDSPADQLKLTFDKFNMTTLNQLTKTSGIQLNGMLNGDVLFTSILKTPGVDSRLTIDSLQMNKTMIGNVKVLSTLGNDRKQANVKLNILNRGLETLNIAGVYYLGKEAGDKLDFDVKMNKTEMLIFTPFLKDLVSDLKGTISADLKLTGSITKPQLNGDITLENTGLTVNYLKTAYIVNNKLTVNNSVISMDGVVLKDMHGGSGTIEGKIDLSNLSNPTLDVTLHATNLLALNTTYKDNHLYYGTAYSTGTFKFTGPVDNMYIDIDASTEAGTVFNLPLNTSETANNYDFIRFQSHKDTTGTALAKTNMFKGITLFFKLNVDEKSIVRITTDMGTLEGSGKSREFKMKINSLGDFEIVGDFGITTGKFEFTAKNVFNKTFTINQGGTIRWTGDPTNAEINLNAVYEVRTDISNLYTAAGLVSPAGRKQVLVQAVISITKSLVHPHIEFDFNFPTDPSIKEDVGTYLADEGNRSKQAVSIITERNFSTGGSNTNLTNQVVNTAKSAFNELVFNKVNAITAESIKGVDLNVRSFSDASASVKLFHERVVLNGSLYNSENSGDVFNSSNNLLNSNFNNLTKDFEASYLIRKDASLTARYSYRVLNTTTVSSAVDQLTPQYVNGLGIVYQKDFDNFGEFFKAIFTFRRHKQTTTPVIPNSTPPATNPNPAALPPAKKEDENQ